MAKNSSRPLEFAPHSVDSEESLLGSLLMNGGAYWKVAAILQPGDFFILRHGWIYEAMAALAERNEPVDDIRLIAVELETRGRLSDIGGEAYLNYLPSTVPSALNAEYYAHIIRRKAVRRVLLSAAGEVARLAHDEELDTEEVIDRAQAAIFAIGQEDQRGVVTFDAALSEVYDDLEAERDGKPSTLRMTTPWHDLNRLIGGFEGGQLIIPAARPGNGKSAWMMQVATHAARLGMRPLLCSMEMSQRELIARIIAQETGIPTDRQHAMSDTEWSAFLAWVETRAVHLSRMVFETRGRLTSHKVAALARDLKRRGGLDLLIVDYLQLMRGDRDADNRNNELADITRSLKQLAMELDIPIIAASQLNRASVSGKPGLHHLRDSGALEQDANMVIFIHDPAPSGEGDTIQDGKKELIVAKNRNGPTGTVPMVWVGKRVMFGDPARV